MDPIRLTQLELDFAVDQGEKRHVYAVKAGYTKALQNGKDDIEQQIMACKGEVGMTKLMGVYPSCIFDYVGHVGMPDVVINGFSIDIKTTPKKTNDLMIKMEQRFSDVFVLAAVDEEDPLMVWYLGWEWGWAAMQPTRIFAPRESRPGYKEPCYKTLNGQLNYGWVWDMLRKTDHREQNETYHRMIELYLEMIGSPKLSEWRAYAKRSESQGS